MVGSPDGGSTGPTGAAQKDEQPYGKGEPETIEAFREVAVDLVEWHRARGEGVERKAANLLGLAGLALVLVPFAVDNPAGIGGASRAVLVWSAGAAAGLIVGAAVLCVLILRPRKSLAPESSQFQRAWADFRADRREVAADVHARYADSLLACSDGKPSVLSSIMELSDSKATLLGWAAIIVGAAIVALAAAAVAALTGA